VTLHAYFLANAAMGFFSKSWRFRDDHGFDHLVPQHLDVDEKRSSYVSELYENRASK
jgi:hypothetical protein